MKYLLLSIALILSMRSTWAGEQPLITISDPSGDDHGAGTLVYPQRADFQVGDLDLLQMKISRDEEGFWFEAMFKNAIRDPGDVPDGVGGESLANFARKGFYQFNLDIYVDTDRIKGSGNTFTLPGRQVAIAPSYAWERAVILTPRPELMRQQLLDALIEQYHARTKTEIETSVDQIILFPTRVRVHGRSVSFFVPAGFFADSDGSDWAIVAMVTGAITTPPADLSFFPSTKTPLERLRLGVMQPAPGHPQDTFGYSGAPPNPVVDLLSDSALQQARQHATNSIISGVAWGRHAANDNPASLVATDVSKVEQKPAGLNDAKPVASISSLFQPDVSPAARPIEVMPTDASPPGDQSITKRLQTLQQLFDQKLIDEADYQQQKQRILNNL